MSYKDLSDEEIVELIVEAIEEDGRVEMDFIRVECNNSKPVLSGRVVSDEQLQIIDEIMMDVLDIQEYENTIWVDDELAFDNVDDDDEEDDDDELDGDDGYDGGDEDE